MSLSSKCNKARKQNNHNDNIYLSIYLSLSLSLYLSLYICIYILYIYTCNGKRKTRASVTRVIPDRRLPARSARVHTGQAQCMNTSMCVYIYIYICMCVYIYIYKYIYTHYQFNDFILTKLKDQIQNTCVYIYIYIYTCIIHVYV